MGDAGVAPVHEQVPPVAHEDLAVVQVVVLQQLRQSVRRQLVASSRTRAEASRNRGSASISSISRSYFSGSVASRMSGTPSASSRSTSSARSSWTPAYSRARRASAPGSARAATTVRSYSPASAISIQPRRGVGAPAAAVRRPGGGRRSARPPRPRAAAVAVGLEPHGAGLGRHPEHRRPRVDVRLLDVAGAGEPEPASWSSIQAWAPASHSGSCQSGVSWADGTDSGHPESTTNQTPTAGSSPSLR